MPYQVREMGGPDVVADRTFVLDIIFIPTALVCFFLQRCNCCSLYKYLCPALISNKLSVHPDQRGGRPCIGDQSLDKSIRFTIIYRREEDKQLRLCLSPHSKQALKLSMDSAAFSKCVWLACNYTEIRLWGSDCAPQNSPQNQTKRGDFSFIPGTRDTN